MGVSLWEVTGVPTLKMLPAFRALNCPRLWVSNNCVDGRRCKRMTPKEAAAKLKETLATAQKPKISVKNGKVEVKTSDGQTEEVSEIQKHKFSMCI